MQHQLTSSGGILHQEFWLRVQRLRYDADDGIHNLKDEEFRRHPFWYKICVIYHNPKIVRTSSLALPSRVISNCRAEPFVEQYEVIRRSVFVALTADSGQHDRP